MALGKEEGWFVLGLGGLLASVLDAFSVLSMLGRYFLA